MRDIYTDLCYCCLMHGYVDSVMVIVLEKEIGELFEFLAEFLMLTFTQVPGRV